MSHFTNKVIIKLIFSAHALVATISHIAVIMLIGGAFNLLIASEGLSFWTKGMLFGLLFFSAMYGVNHVTNRDGGFCFLTELENMYRKHEGMAKVGPFMPRYYAEVRKLFKRIKR